jgi:uncharacterized membrane protein YesL
MRKYGLRATAVVLLNLIIGSFVTLTLLILRQMGMGQLLPVLALLATTFVTMLLLLGNIYLWPLLVTVDPPLPDLLRNALRLAVHHPFWGLLVAAAALLPFLVSFFLPQLFYITVTFAASALIVYAGAWRVLRRYLDENSIQNLRA